MCDRGRNSASPRAMRDDRRMRRAERWTTLQFLWVAFAVQVAGRLLDFWWHATHEGFETGRDQVQAHWLVWLGTVLVLLVSGRALMAGVEDPVRVGYLVVVAANAAYIPIAVAHYLQHLDHREVDWAHAGLGITNLIAAIGVLYVAYASRRQAREAG